MSHEYDSEPVPGLPERLPPGEHILWQGAPDWRELAMHVFHVRAVAVYFAILIAWRAIAGMWDGAPLGAVAGSTLILFPVGAAALGLLALLARLMARSTIYTITNERVVIRAGVAIPKAINIPFSVIESAAMRRRPSGAGDVPLCLTDDNRAAYLHLWPHVRPWRFNRAEPMLRGLPEVEKVAQVLSGALAARAGQTGPRIVPAGKTGEDAREARPRAAAALAEA